MYLILSLPRKNYLEFELLNLLKYAVLERNFDFVKI